MSQAKRTFYAQISVPFAQSLGIPNENGFFKQRMLLYYVTYHFPFHDQNIQIKMENDKLNLRDGHLKSAIS